MSARILVVDDDRALSEMLGMVLQGEGFETVFAADGPSAVGREGSRGRVAVAAAGTGGRWDGKPGGGSVAPQSTLGATLGRELSSPLADASLAMPSGGPRPPP